jgi:hypothetical protein
MPYSTESDLLEALKRILPHPIFGTTDIAKEREFWEYEKTQGRGCADDMLFALNAIEKAEEKMSQQYPQKVRAKGRKTIGDWFNKETDPCQGQLSLAAYDRLFDSLSLVFLEEHLKATLTKYAKQILAALDKAGEK